jgi:hypothetical protein
MSTDPRRHLTPPHLRIPDDLIAEMLSHRIDGGAVALHLAAWSESSRWTLDGILDRTRRRRLSYWTPTRERSLIDAGFWIRHLVGDRIVIDGYLEYNRSRAEIVERREQRARAGARRAENADRDPATGAFVPPTGGVVDPPTDPPTGTVFEQSDASKSLVPSGSGFKESGSTSTSKALNPASALDEEVTQIDRVLRDHGWKDLTERQRKMVRDIIERHWDCGYDLREIVEVALLEYDDVGLDAIEALKQHDRDCLRSHRKSA